MCGQGRGISPGQVLCGGESREGSGQGRHVSEGWEALARLLCGLPPAALLELRAGRVFPGQRWGEARTVPPSAHGVVLLVEEARTRPASVPLGRTATWSAAPGRRMAHMCSVPRCWAATPRPRAWGLGGLGRRGQADSCRRWSPGVGGPADARETTGFWKGPVSVERERGTCALPCPVQTIGALQASCTWLMRPHASLFSPLWSRSQTPSPQH